MAEKLDEKNNYSWCWGHGNVVVDIVKLCGDRVIGYLDDMEKAGAIGSTFFVGKKFFEENGNLDISQEYQTESVWLGKWLYEQRQMNLGKKKGKLYPWSW